MKNLHLKGFKPILTLVLLLVCFEVFSQAGSGPPPPPDGGGGDGTVNDVPINFIVYPLMLLASYLGFRFFNKKA